VLRVPKIRSLCQPAPRCRRQIRPDQGFRLNPNDRITLNLSVWLREDTVVPGIPGGFEGTRFIVKSEASNDTRPRWIGGANVVVPAKKSMRLYKLAACATLAGIVVSLPPALEMLST